MFDIIFSSYSTWLLSMAICLTKKHIQTKYCIRSLWEFWGPLLKGQVGEPEGIFAWCEFAAAYLGILILLTSNRIKQGETRECC